MPVPKDRSKHSGDVHPPEVEDTGPAGAEDTEIESTPGKGENQAGFLKDRDGMGTTRDKDSDSDSDKG
ncbi:MAG TPA: hypothetical protein VF522_11830 [Ramlibacter sp.]|uniref:hypothetical protein n=1 Tax=Ramlibacter sp. TaxID=1917967 RepID=UPI002ED04ACB